MKVTTHHVEKQISPSDYKAEWDFLLAMHGENIIQMRYHIKTQTLEYVYNVVEKDDEFDSMLKRLYADRIMFPTHIKLPDDMFFKSPFLYSEPLPPNHKTDNQHESTGA